MSGIDRKKIVSLLTLIAFMGVLQAPVFAKSWFHPFELLEKKPTFNVPKKYDTPQLQGNNRMALLIVRLPLAGGIFFLILILSP